MTRPSFSLLEDGELLPEELSEEAAGWVRRILQLAGRSKSARPVCDDTMDGVLIERMESENVVAYGPQLVALDAWEKLGLSPMLKDAGLNASQIATARLLVAGRLIEPSSEWALIDWAERTALPELPELLDLRVTKSTKDRLYHAGDALFAHRKTIEVHLREREAGLFDSAGGIVLHDMTNTHFEGLCAKNPKAHHGKNKQHRDDCRQLAIGMAFDARGLALAHDVFEGNFAAGGFGTVPGRDPKSPVEGKAIADPDDAGGRLVLCRSALRREKEGAMLSRAEARFLDDLAVLRGRIEDFACLKGSLGLRPKFHPLPGRVEAHLFIRVLAYHLLTCIRETLAARCPRSSHLPKARHRLESGLPPPQILRQTMTIL